MVSIATQDMVVHADLAWILPNPYQVEGRDNPEQIGELATSILEHGMVETPVGRAKIPDRLAAGIELASGHRRLAAHRALVAAGHEAFGRMRLRIAELTDVQMADIVIQENKKREDLDPIAEARFYRRYMADFTVTQTEIARRVGLSQPEVCNTLRLLELPEVLQQKLVTREITARHGREFLRIVRWPKLHEKAIGELSKDDVPTVAQYEMYIDSLIMQSAKPLDARHWSGPAKFGLAECKSCADSALARVYGKDKKQRWCLKAGCWEAKQKGAEERERQETTKKLSGKGAGTVHDSLDYRTYERLQQQYDGHGSRVDNPTECETCEHRHYLKGWRNEAEEICVNLTCFRAKERKKRKEDNRKERESQQKVTKRIEAALQAHPSWDRTVLLLILDGALRHSPDDVADWFHNEYGLTKKYKADTADRLATVLKDRTDQEIEMMIPRLALEGFRSKYFQRVDHLNHHLRALEGGPTHIQMEGQDGEVMRFDLDDIVQVEEWEHMRGETPRALSLTYRIEGGAGSCPITQETFDYLTGLGIKKSTRWMTAAEIAATSRQHSPDEVWVTCNRCGDELHPDDAIAVDDGHQCAECHDAETYVDPDAGLELRPEVVERIEHPSGEAVSIEANEETPEPPKAKRRKARTPQGAKSAGRKAGPDAKPAGG